jgi:hypothetical protein
MHARILVGSFAAVALVVSSLGAQRAPLRAAATLDVGMGGGLAGVRCEGCIPSDASAVSGFVRVGRGIMSNVIASLEWARWSRPQFGQHGQYDFLTIGPQVYLLPGIDLWGRSGIGYGRTSYVAMPFEPDVYRTERSGLAFSAAMGYDLRVSDRIVLGPFLMVSTMQRGSARVNGQDSPYDVSASLFQYGMSIGFR